TENSMQPSDPLSRRNFVTTTSLLAGGLLATSAAATEEEPLAIDGGPKAVTTARPHQARWGEPERQQLEAMLEQNSLMYWKGPQTTQMIERFQQFCPLEQVMTCSSGTAALHIAVSAAGIGLGDEVITSPITDIGTVIGVLYQQAVPVFADLLPHTYNLDPADVERRITPKTKAIIAVHLAGNPCDMQALRRLADKHSLVLIEDCCQGWGARYDGQPLGTHGHIACFSLQNSKLITCGDGGVVASSDSRFGPLLQPLGDKGMLRGGGDGLFHRFATNYRMSEPQAAVAAGQLTRLEKIAATRARLGNLLGEKLAGTPGIDLHEVRSEDRCVYWFYMLRVRPEAIADRAKFVKALSAEGVPASAGYIPVPLYGNPVFQEHGFFQGRWPVKEMGLTNMDYSQVQCPEVDAILSTGVRVVVNEAMTEEYIVQLARAIRKVAKHMAA
ncbi:MAG: DegT/DnrJ/EryC1/StrS family aminotransferase, partial [Planctomycetales bacterium]|nr:DegT/DnrJ/EryC1/StrS family aminotransferase [Planctomycetales bacterium]